MSYAGTASAGGYRPARPSPFLRLPDLEALCGRPYQLRSGVGGLDSATYPVEPGDAGFTLQTCDRRASKFAPSQSLPDVDFAGFARGLGLDGVTIDDPDEFGLWDRVLNDNRPAVPDIRCDPDVLPIPACATFAQQTSLAGVR